MTKTTPQDTIRKKVIFEIDESLHRTIKAAAATRGQTMRQWLVDAIHHYLKQPGATIHSVLPEAQESWEEIQEPDKAAVTTGEDA